MDRFSKTTEIDTAEIAAAAMEDDAPKKSKLTTIIALIVCILLSVVIWVFVMEADTTTSKKKISDVPVYTAESGDVPSAYAQVIVNGVRRDIVDFKSSDFKISQENGTYTIEIVNKKADSYKVNVISKSSEKFEISVSKNENFN